MSDGPIIDPAEFAKAADELRGSVQVSALPRLADVLADTEGILAFVVSGRLDHQGYPRLRMSVSGALHLRCQRCLGRLDSPLDIAGELKLVPNAAALGDVAEEAARVDEIVAPREMNVLEWLEDEVLLALPMAARHEPSRNEASACDRDSSPAEDGDNGCEASARSFATGSFATLAGFKSRDDKDN